MIGLAKGLKKQVASKVRVKVGENISGWVAKTGEPLLIKDITKDKRFNIRKGKYYTNSLLSVRIRQAAPSDTGRQSKNRSGSATMGLLVDASGESRIPSMVIGWCK